MNQEEGSAGPLIGTVALAAVLWVFAFRMGGAGFWIKISLSAVLLAGLAFRFQPNLKESIRFKGRTILLGLLSAVALYLLFWSGQVVSTFLFPFASPQIGEIYGLGRGVEAWQVALILFFVTGPAEEIYWRGFLQRRLSARWGGFRGYLVATALYAGVHLCTMNFMLICAAALAGAFWGLIYWRTGDLGANIVSHSVWTAAAFAVLPLS